MTFYILSITAENFLGDVAQFIAVARLIYAHQQELPEGIQLPVSDQETLRTVEKQIYSEFSHVLGLAEEEVLPFILKAAGKT